MIQRYESSPLVAESEPPFGNYEPGPWQRALMQIVRTPPLNRGKLRRPMANLLRACSKNGTIDLWARGAAFRVGRGANLIEDALLVRPQYNSAEIDFLIDGTPRGGTFIDLGANVGLYTLALAAQIGPQGKVLAIDANQDIVQALEFNRCASGFDNVVVANVAVGEAEFRARLEIHKQDLAIVEVVEDQGGSVAVRPLADIVREAGITQVDTLKADIEGFEDRALIPYFDSVDEPLRPRRMVIEHLSRHEWRTDCFPVFERLGYRVVRRTRGNTLFQRARGAGLQPDV